VLNVKCRKRNTNEKAVSPVIAVILLLAITVILASVSYVMFSNMIPSQESAKVVGVNVEKHEQNYSITIATISGALSISDVYLVTKNKSGEMIINGTPLSEFSGFIDVDPTGELNGGDYILLPIATHPVGARYQLSTDVSVLTEGAFS
jgi:flagellin-like protein